MTVAAWPPALLWPFAVAVAAMLGSFLNVCIARLPRDQSIVFPPSHCPSCRTPIRPYDNVPLLSFLLLGGRCRACRAPISWRYPLVEALAVGLVLVVLWQLGPSGAGLRAFVLGLALIAVTFIDLEWQLIPDRITLPGTVAGLALQWEGFPGGAVGAVLGAGAFAGVVWWRGGARPPSPAVRGAPPEAEQLGALEAGAWGALVGRQVGVVDVPAVLAAPVSPGRLAAQLDPFVLGALLAGLIFYAIAVASPHVFGKEGLGGGDIKLVAMLGAFLGWQVVLVALFLGVLAGGISGIVLILAGLSRFGQHIAFGPFLALGGLAAALWGQPLLGWYLALLG